MSLRDEINQARGAAPVPENSSPAPKVETQPSTSLASEIAAAKAQSETPAASTPAPTRSKLGQELASAIPEILDPVKLDQAENNILQKAQAGLPVTPAELEQVGQRVQDKQHGVDLYKTMVTPTGEIYASLGEKFVSSILGTTFAKNAIAGLAGSKKVEGAAKYTPANAAARIGEQLSSENLLKAFGMPGTVDLPPEVKYGPMIGQALEGVQKLTGIPIDKMPDRLVLGAFIDSCLIAGATRTLSRLAVNTALKSNPEQIMNVVHEWRNSQPELLNFMEREIARQEQAAVRSAVKSGAQATDTELAQIKDKLAQTLWDEKTVAPDEIVIGNAKFKNVEGKWVPIKQVGEMDTLKAAKQAIEDTKVIASESERAAKAAIEAHVKLPAPGEADLNQAGSFAVGVSHWLSSPRYVVPELYDLHSEKVAAMAAMKAKYWKALAPYADIQSQPDRVELIGKILDGVANHPDIANTWTNLSTHEAEALQVFRQSWDEMGDMLYDITKSESLKPGNRILTYLTHIVRDHMTPNKVMVPDRLQQMVNTGEKFLKSRSGVEGFKLNPFEAFEEYTNWATEKMADAAIRPKWEQVLTSYDGAKASYGKWFWNNTHRISNMPVATKAAISAVRDNIYRATLGWNLSASLINRSQSFLFGSARIGYGPLVRGIKLAQEAKAATVEGQRLRDILNTSGIFDDMSEMIVNRQYNKSAGLMDRFAKQSMNWFSNSERWNKSVTYLGSYEDVLNMIQKVKAAPGKFPGTSAKLQHLKVDLSKDAVDQAHRVAYRAVMDTQLDMSKSGQNYLASNPLLGLMTMYSSFPIKAAEYAGHTLMGAAKKIIRDPWRFYQHAEVREATRFAINAGVLYTVLSAAGVAPSNIVGPENFLPNMSPALKTLMRSWSTAQAIAENTNMILTGQKGPAGLFDPNFQKDSYLTQKGRQMFLRDLSLIGVPGLISLPGSAQAWKVFKFMKIVSDNLDNKTGQWNVYDPQSGALKYKTSPLSVLKTLFLPSQDEEHYFAQIKEDFNKTQRQKNAGRTIQRMLLEGDMAGAAQMAQEFGIRPRLSRSERQLHTLTAEQRRERKNRGKR